MIKRHFKGRIMHGVVEHNDVFYFGGVTASDTSVGMEDQTSQICSKIDKLLADCGLSKTNLITAMIYLSDFSKKEEMNGAWLAWLPAESLPTRATIGVADLGSNVLIEVVVSAAR
jgi:enamine deaminase RidA (YjgF/YER057c/UK114 family)